jgi:hypothetical protein
MTATPSSFSCEEFAERLGDLLERDVDESTRAGMEAHALGCTDCGLLLADLRQLRIDAANMPVLEPSRDLWDGIAARIDAPVIPINTGEWRASRGDARVVRRRAMIRVASIAAALVFAAGLGGIATYTMMPHASTTRVASNDSALTPADTALTLGSRAPSNGAATAPTPPTAPQQLASNDASAAGGNEERNAAGASTASLGTSPRTPTRAVANTAVTSAEKTFDAEIARLRTIVNQRRTQLDPATIAVVERNLQVIDEAITQCKAALAKDPASRFLIESLNDALANKVELLRTAAMLPSRT